MKPIHRAALIAGMVLAAYARAAQPASPQPSRPLPLASNYNTGQLPGGFDPQWQLQMIRKGHHLILSFDFPGPDAEWTERAAERFTGPLQAAASSKRPISFLSGEWEAPLYREERYRDLPPESSPLVVGKDGRIKDFANAYPPGTAPGVSPFGSETHWYELGKRWTGCEFFRNLERLYPDPPFVVFISNNEARKLTWQNVEWDKRYLDRYGEGRGDDFKRKVAADGYARCYKALLNGMREGMTAWRDRAILGAYGASPLRDMGMSDDWREPRLYVPGEQPFEARAWDCVAPSQYITSWNANTDYTVNSPQMCAMNLVVQDAIFRKVNPDIFPAVSVWDAGWDPRPTGTEKYEYWRLQGQSVPPERYAGFVKWAMWLPRASIVYDFRWWHEKREQAGGAYEQVIAAVDEIHAHPVLGRFWQQGRLVANSSGRHPFRYAVPRELEDVGRWFLLDCDANDAPRPWELETPVHVWSFAYELGEAPEREWLVYAQAPLSARVGVSIELPGFGPVRATAPQAGAYYHVTETAREVIPVAVGGPASVRVRIEGERAPGGSLDFSVVDVFHPRGEFVSFEWDFGDGATATGAAVVHAYAGSGAYAVRLKAMDRDGAAVERIELLQVGPTDPDLVLFYDMAPLIDGGLFDLSGHGHAARLEGVSRVQAAGPGPALELDGRDDYAVIFPARELNTGESYSSRTVRLHFLVQDAGPRQVLYEEGGGANGLNLYVEEGRLYAGLWAAETLPEGTFLSAPVQAKQWGEAAVVLREAGQSVEDDRLELYLDGELKARGPASVLPRHAGDVNLGRSGGSRFHDGTLNPKDKQGRGQAAFFFDGRLGELRVYNRALAAEELRLHTAARGVRRRGGDRMTDAAGPRGRVLMLLFDGFEYFETLVPILRLREEGYAVTVVSDAPGQVAGGHGFVLEADASFDSVSSTDYAALVVPGGNEAGYPGEMRGHAGAVRLMRAFADADKPIAAICMGVGIMAESGVLAGRRAACDPGTAQLLKDAGAEYVDQPLVTDGPFVTSRYWPDLTPFCRELVHRLRGRRPVLMLTGPGFEDVDVRGTFYRLREEGWRVALASPEPALWEGRARLDERGVLVGRGGVTTWGVPASLSEVRCADHAGLFLPGGPAAVAVLKEQPAVLRLVRAFHREGLPLAAVGAGCELLEAASVALDADHVVAGPDSAALPNVWRAFTGKLAGPPAKGGGA